MDLKLNQKGMSLVGVVVTAGVVSVVTLTLTSLLNQSLKSAGLVEHKAARLEIKNRLAVDVITNEEQCKVNFIGATIPSDSTQPLEVNEIYYRDVFGQPVGNAIVKVDPDNYISDQMLGLKVVDIQFTNHQDQGGGVITSDLEVHFESNKGPLKPLVMPAVRMEVDGARKVTNCGMPEIIEDGQQNPEEIGRYSIGGWALNGGEQVAEHNAIKGVMRTGQGYYEYSAVNSRGRTSVAHFQLNNGATFRIGSLTGADFGSDITIVHKRDWIGIARGICGQGYANTEDCTYATEWGRSNRALVIGKN